MVLRHVVSALIGLRVGELSRRFKEREVTCGLTAPPVIVRLDGVKFGSRLRGLSWPRDERVHRALLEAGKAIMSELGADMCYIVSDEINVFFTKYVPYGGRVFKIVSITSGIASSLVSLNLGRILFFDSRIVKIDNLHDVKTYILYRARVGLNNYLGSIFAARRYSQRGYTPTIDELVSTLREHLEGPEWTYLGTLLVKRQVSRKAVNKITGEEVEVKRNVITELPLEQVLTRNMYDLLTT